MTRKEFENVFGQPVRIFFRKSSNGIILMGKLVGDLDEMVSNEMVFDGFMSQDLLLSGKFRKPKQDDTEGFSNQTIMEFLGKL